MGKENIIAVASGKGGVGKTWLSITIANAFANSGRKALLFDGDIGLANVDVQLGLSPKKDLGDVMSGKVELHEAITTYDKGKFDIIAGRSGSGSLANLSVDKINALRKDLDKLSKSYDVVILDLGAGIESQVQALARLAQKCLIVITDEPTSLTDAYAFIKILRIVDPGIDIQIIINMAENQREGMKTFANIKNACENFLKFSPKLAAIIRRDPKVKEAIKTQTSMLVKYSKSLAAADVSSLAIKLMAK
jgi:flagellar biosynthesis protein FlhG